MLCAPISCYAGSKRVAKPAKNYLETLVLQDENTIHMNKTSSNIYTKKARGRLQHARNDKVKNEIEITACCKMTNKCSRK
jgi:hypothetical protein